MKTFKINEKCIGCMACQRVAPENFEIRNKKAVLIKQPINEQELENVERAAAVCPTEAIEAVHTNEGPSAELKHKVVLGQDNVRKTLEMYPFLKKDLLELSDRFNTMQNPIMWNSAARFATFEQAAKMTNISICEILHFINKKLGLEDELMKAFPQCLQELKQPVNKAEAQLWTVDEKFIINNELDYEKAIYSIEALKPGHTIQLEGNASLKALIGFLKENGLDFQERLLAGDRMTLTIRNQKDENNRVLDVRQMTTDPFDEIIQTAYAVNPNESFTLIQTFKPDPIINMLSSMGFTHSVEYEAPNEVRIKFTKIEEVKYDDAIAEDKPALTIQSATAVGYPIIMRLLQSERLRERIKIKELKIWEETEKHLAWIVNNRADISFSAVITATKFKNAAVKMPVVFVWDNFVLLSRNTEARSLKDLKGETIRMPLFEDAPPAKITRYLLESEGLTMKDFDFKYGNPFGRPKELMEAFISGKADHVLLREPEASFAVAAVKKKGIPFSEIGYNKLFNKANPGFGMFPNAGMIVKKELYDKYPDIMQIFEEELELAIKWVNENHRKAAELSFDMMRNSVENVESFIDRVHFEYKSGEELVEKMEKFYKILADNNILPIEVDEKLLSMFRH